MSTPILFQLKKGTQNCPEEWCHCHKDWHSPHMNHNLNSLTGSYEAMATNLAEIRTPVDAQQPVDLWHLGFFGWELLKCHLEAQKSSVPNLRVSPKLHGCFWILPCSWDVSGVSQKNLECKFFFEEILYLLPISDLWFNSLDVWTESAKTHLQRLELLA